MASIKNFSLFLFWTFLILYLSFSPIKGWPQPTIFQKLYLDKVVHIVMYAVLGLLLLRSIFIQRKKQTLRFETICYALIFASTIGIAVEFLQPVLTMYRKFEWMDMIANTAGVLLGLYIYKWLRSRRYFDLNIL